MEADKVDDASVASGGIPVATEVAAAGRTGAQAMETDEQTGVDANAMVPGSERQGEGSAVTSVQGKDGVQAKEDETRTAAAEDGISKRPDATVDDGAADAAVDDGAAIVKPNETATKKRAKADESSGEKGGEYNLIYGAGMNFNDSHEL